MNNTQLAILLEKYQKLLENALSEMWDELPAEMLKQSTNILGMVNSFFPVLVPLQNIIDMIENDIEALKKHKDD